MRWKVVVAIALGLWPATTVGSKADTMVSGDRMERLVQAAYFSAACRNEAETLGIVGTTDANALVTAFVTVWGLVGVAPKTSIPHDDCGEPVTLLINLLRLNGVDAELAFVSNEQTNVVSVDGVSVGKTDRPLVYVPSLDRYFDPVVPIGGQAVLHRIAAEKAMRTHILGPSLAGYSRGGCRSSTCMHVYSPRNESSVRVRTEAIRDR
jgi:hypothetical protein